MAIDSSKVISNLTAWSNSENPLLVTDSIHFGLKDSVAGGSRPNFYPRDFSNELQAWLQGGIDKITQQGCLACRKALWPGGAPFAVFLSHDIDQIHDRELFRWLGDANHLRRHWFKGEQGRTGPCIRRILRPLLKPINPMQQFTAIRALQSRHGWKSTFYLLEDQYWKKKGGRYRWDDRALSKIADFLLSDGCELGIHGSAYSHDQPEWWVEKRQRFQNIFGVPALGTRNHYLGLHVPNTWRAQQHAGMVYDATLGYPSRLGAPGGFCFPFDVASLTESPERPLIQLPLTIMDVTLFRYLTLDKTKAINAAEEEITTVRKLGGLVSILWHNNFFAEPEYSDWEETYAHILDSLAVHSPWVARGIDIANWWLARSKVSLVKVPTQDNKDCWEINSPVQIDNLAVELFGLGKYDEIMSEIDISISKPDSSVTKIVFPTIPANTSIRFFIRKGA